MHSSAPCAGRSSRDGQCDDGGVSAPQAVFRTSPLAVLGAVAIAVCFTPVAFAGPFLWLLYLVPIAMVVWVLRVRTTADADALAVRKVVGERRVPWSEISSLRLDKRRVSAVLSDGAELPLPAVGLSDLPQLAAVSGGRLPDPAGD
jgi:Bacterial PH domain